MTKLSLSILSLSMFFWVSAGCNEGNEETVGTTVKSSTNEAPPTEKKILSEEQYRLVEINGQFTPHGGVYEYDSEKKLWCERPMAADLMSYMKMKNTQSIEDLPDLNMYFDEQTTNEFNSCIIKVSDYGDSKDFFLYYKGNMIYQNALKVDDNIGKPQTFNVKMLNDFNLPEIGSMDYSNGKNYVITIEDPKASIVFSNESGEYELGFLKTSKSSTAAAPLL